MSKKTNLKMYNTSTLEQTSEDDNNGEHMTKSQLKVINFDSVGGKKYTRNNNLSIQLKTNDVLFLHNDERYTFIEFKNGKLLDKSNRIDIKKLKDIELKILNSMFVLGDIEEKSLNTLKEITNYILDFIVELEGYQYSNFVNVILWGTEKGNSIKNEDLNRSLNLIENDHYIRVGNIYYNFKDELKFLSHKGNKHSGIGKADLFVNQYGSKRWFGVNVKLNIEDLKMSKTPELPIGIALKTNKFGRQRKALVEHGYTRFDPDYFTYVFQKEKDFGEYFLKYFSDIFSFYF